MNQFDSILRMYSDNGLRTSEDWMARGRDIADGVKARVDMPHRGVMLALFSRDQTQPHKSARPQGAGHAMAASEA